MERPEHSSTPLEVVVGSTACFRSDGPVLQVIPGTFFQSSKRLFDDLVNTNLQILSLILLQKESNINDSHYP
jgi:hypothetical protein